MPWPATSYTYWRGTSPYLHAMGVVAAEARMDARTDLKTKKQAPTKPQKNKKSGFEIDQVSRSRGIPTL